MIGISGSEMALWTRCPRSWLVAYYYGLVPAAEVPVGNAQLGIRIHTALEGLYGYTADPLKITDLLYRTAIEEHPDYEPELRREWELGKAMVEGYCEWVLNENMDADLKVLDTEGDILVPLPGVPGVGLRARIDLSVLQVSTGFAYFLDFKTAASFEKHEILELDPQFRTYSLISHLKAGLDWNAPHPPFVPVLGGGMIRTLRRVKRTEKAVPPFYRHDPFRYSPDQLTSTLLRCQSVCTEIMTARAHLDEGYRTYGGSLEVINNIQRYHLRPVPIITDCAWRCPLANGACVAMDDGSDWPAMLEQSGRWKRQSPYLHYERGGIASIKDHLARL